MTAVAPVTDTSCELGGHRWNLRYPPSALHALEMMLGDLNAFSARLISQNMGQGMTLETQALLIWAGQRPAEPKLKLGWVKRFLANMHPVSRVHLATWAAADFCRAMLERVEASIEAVSPAAESEEDGDEL